MEKQLYNNVLRMLENGLKIKGSFCAEPYGRSVEINSADEEVNDSMNDWFSDFEDLLYEAENYQSDSGEIELFIGYNCIQCKIIATINDKYSDKHSKDELLTKKFLEIISQYASKTIDELIKSDIEFNLNYVSTKNEFTTLDIYVDENCLNLTEEDLNQLKEEIISVFDKWDDNYQGEDYDHIEKYIEYSYDENEFDVTEYITINREVEPMDD